MATLVRDDVPMNLNATQPEASPQLRSSPLRFSYASGARPLSGYTLKRGIGRGGFGEVYYAVSDAGKEVALKLIRRNLDIELRGVTHCLNLKHPNLLAIYDVKQDDQDNSWVIMEYMAGESLEEVIQRCPTGLPKEEVLAWIRGIAAGVGYLHDHGIVHRDLKPGNIFADEGIVKLGDYGLSKFISCSRRSGQTESVGTVHYMAPEVANGRYGKEIDIYALGIILYEMLTGRVPFEGESVGEVLMKHLTAEPDLTALPDPFRTVVARALAKDPTIRFSSVEEMMADLPLAPAGPSHFASQRHSNTPSPAHAETLDHRPPPAAPPIPAPLDTDEEPIWKAVRQFCQRLSEVWASANLGTPGKIIVLVVALWFLASNVGWMIHVLGVLVVAYGAYRIVRAVVIQRGSHPRAPMGASKQAPPVAQGVAQRAAPAPAPGGTPNPASPPTALAAGTRSIAPCGLRKRWQDKPLAALVVKTPRERAADLAGSMLLSACVAGAMGVVMVLLRGQQSTIEQYVWLTLVSTAGAWAVLIPSKLWEGTKGDPVIRRFVLLVIGLGLGAIAYGVDASLFVQLPFENIDVLGVAQPDRYAPGLLGGQQLPHGFYNETDGSPQIYAYLAYFGFIFLLVRWWRQADPLRSSRISLWATACSVMSAWIINLFWPFPQPWGFMVAATISLAVQLASPVAAPGQRFGRSTA